MFWKKSTKEETVLRKNLKPMKECLGKENYEKLIIKISKMQFPENLDSFLKFHSISETLELFKYFVDIKEMIEKAKDYSWKPNVFLAEIMSSIHKRLKNTTCVLNDGTIVGKFCGVLPELDTGNLYFIIKPEDLKLWKGFRNVDYTTFPGLILVSDEAVRSVKEYIVLDRKKLEIQNTIDNHSSHHPIS